MCGIAGIMTVSGAPPDDASIERMGTALAHRGPDALGYYRSRNCAMVHRRLAIIDLETGDQPLYGPDGIALIANSEIYNYLELKMELVGDDVPFSTVSDCEPPLHLYRRYGNDFARSLRGMYALALHDPTKDRLVLSRDPFGIKPLYYAETSNEFAFASEPQALLAAEIVPRMIDERARNELLQLQFTTGPETIYPKIRRVMPGETLTVSGGKVIDRQRRSALSKHGPVSWNEEEALEHLDSALYESVSFHQRSDVPYGMFLSGGVDSAALLLLMTRLNKSPVRAFTAGFVGGKSDERVQARVVAKSLGAEHLEVEVDENDFWSLMPEIAAAMDDPAADYAILPTYKLARLAAQDLKVILTGEGGDELFAGYGRYRSAMRPWWQGGRVMRSKGIFDGLGVLNIDVKGWRDGVSAAERTASISGRSRLQILQAADCSDWLPNDLLTKLDRCLMAHRLEGRTPFLDSGIAEVLYRLPDHLKMRNGTGKYLLRRWLNDNLPEAQAFSRKKGFTVPVATWIANHGERLGPLVAEQPVVKEICQPGRVEELYKAKGKRVGLAAWTLLFFALWHRAHVIGTPPSGDVFETLAAVP